MYIWKGKIYMLNMLFIFFLYYFYFFCNVTENVLYFVIIFFLQLYMDIPMFSNLTHLELVFGAYIAWHLVFEVLKNSPMLQSFVLDKPQVLSWPCPLLYYPGFVPQCLSSHFVKCALLQITQEENMMFNLQNTFSRIQHLYGRWRSIVLLLWIHRRSLEC